MDREPDARRDSLWAWASVAFTVAGAVLAQFLGYGISMLLGYAVPEAATPPLGDALLISVPTLVVAVLPGISAMFFGIRAGRGGRPVGYLAAVLGGLTVAFWVFTTVAALVSLS